MAEIGGKGRAVEQRRRGATCLDAAAQGGQRLGVGGQGRRLFDVAVQVAADQLRKKTGFDLSMHVFHAHLGSGGDGLDPGQTGNRGRDQAIGVGAVPELAGSVGAPAPGRPRAARRGGL